MPVLEEAARIEASLASLRRFSPPWEVVVVDGGSTDGTPERAAAVTGLTARVLRAARGRGRQLNAGAAAATADVLLFLHADVELPDDAPTRIAEALRDPDVVAGAFRTRHATEGRRSAVGPLLFIADVRSRVSGLPYGDQALFVRAEAFREAGGFPDEPLMEDIELSRRLRRIGRIRVVPSCVRVSGRRILAAPVRTTLAMNLFPLLFRLGVRPSTLARLYGDPR
jgi:rSAM/selenodomain-associated transferase 2